MTFSSTIPTISARALRARSDSASTACVSVRYIVYHPIATGTTIPIKSVARTPGHLRFLFVVSACGSGIFHALAAVSGVEFYPLSLGQAIGPVRHLDPCQTEMIKSHRLRVHPKSLQFGPTPISTNSGTTSAWTFSICSRTRDCIVSTSFSGTSNTSSS